MQKNYFVLVSAAGLLLLTSCSGKLGALSSDNFTVTPNPLETQTGKVPATINGTFPDKYMKKKVPKQLKIINLLLLQWQVVKEQDLDIMDRKELLK